MKGFPALPSVTDIHTVALKSIFWAHFFAPNILPDS